MAVIEVRIPEDGIVASAIYWWGPAIMGLGLLQAFTLGCKQARFWKALVSSWLIILYGSITIDIFAPLVALKFLGEVESSRFFPETPGTAAILCAGWWPPIVFYWAGRAGRYLVRDMLLRFRPSKKVSASKQQVTNDE